MSKLQIPQVRDQRTEEPILMLGEWFAIGLRRKGWAINRINVVTLSHYSPHIVLRVYHA